MTRLGPQQFLDFQINTCKMFRSFYFMTIFFITIEFLNKDVSVFHGLVVPAYHIA